MGVGGAATGPLAVLSTRDRHQSWTPGGRLFSANPLDRVAARAILVTAATIFDSQCASKVGFRLAPIIQRQIAGGLWNV